MIDTPASLVASNMWNSRYCDASAELFADLLLVPSAVTSYTHIKAQIPLDSFYEPGCYDVVCGRGKGSYNRPGNKHFRALVATFVSDYVNAKTRLDKSAVLGCIVDSVHSLCDPDTGSPARFVKYSKLKGWVEIGKDAAHEKAGHAMREAVMAMEPLPLCDYDESTLLSLSKRSPIHLESLCSRRLSITSIPAIAKTKKNRLVD
jgi:hypothetical protein